MIARHRGDQRVHSRWRPSAPAAPAPALAPTEDDALLSQQPDDLLSGQRELDPPRASHRKPGALIAVATVVAIAFIAGQQHTHTASAPAAPRLPATPQQWVSRWTAATLQSPTEVCDHLYAPVLSRSFKGDTGRSCASYYMSVDSNNTSFRIRRVFEDGPTAAVEVQEVGGRKPGDFTTLLGRIRGGWQAVDLVRGGSVRARQINGGGRAGGHLRRTRGRQAS